MSFDIFLVAFSEGKASSRATWGRISLSSSLALLPEEAFGFAELLVAAGYATVYGMIDLSSGRNLQQMHAHEVETDAALVGRLLATQFPLADLGSVARYARTR